MTKRRSGHRTSAWAGESTSDIYPLVRCLSHAPNRRQTFCYQQFDGSHERHENCTCEQDAAATCPIDVHRVKWTENNPMWEWPAAIARAAQPKPAAMAVSA